MLSLDLACGQNTHPGYIGVDLWPGADIECDLSIFPWPWPDETVDNILCSHYVEHVTDLIGFMNEVWRIMKPDGLVYIAHPYAHNNRAWQDPTHVRALNEDSWKYYNAQARKDMGVDHYPIIANFEIVHIDFILAPGVTHASHADIRYKTNVVDDLQVTLRTVKE